MVEIFKTDIETQYTAELARMRLLDLFPHAKINFDLEDCDRILRIEGRDFSIHLIIEAINILGYNCEILD
ncbi:MAG: hypothetical protein IPQ03_07580 [Bacteroidetes bacterium]|nr:hypothetical protein [Bacteroidota bacterium]